MYLSLCPSGLGIMLKVFIYFFFFSIKAHSGFCSRMLKLAECSTSLGRKKYTLEAHIIVQTHNDCVNEFSTLPGYVFGVHVIFVCRAECFTGVHTCENIVKSPPSSCVCGW